MSRGVAAQEYGKADSVCVCVCSSCNCSTVATQRKLTSIGHVLLDFDSWNFKLKLCSRVMASFTVKAVALSEPFLDHLLVQTFYSSYELSLH